MQEEQKKLDKKSDKKKAPVSEFVMPAKDNYGILLSQNYTPKLLSKIKRSSPKRSSPKRSSVKLKRCPNGFKRNKKTGICEPK